MTQATANPPVGDTAPPSFDLGRLNELFARQRSYHPSVRATTAAQRKEKLRRFESALLAQREEVIEAVRTDFKRPVFEVDLSETTVVLRETRHAIRSLSHWMRPRRVSTPLSITGTRSEVRAEPRGVALIIAPWNYPVQLSLLPLVSAVAAGNCVIIKPSEFTPHCGAWMRRFLGTLFPEDEVAVVEGDVAVSTALLKLPFDHIFFTGSPSVGKVVMRAAAEHLTSVTLELGGKSPAVIDETADLQEAASKIAWGKFTNAGQTCIAPDYVLIDGRVRDAFVTALRLRLDEFFGAEAGKRASTPDYGRMINARHLQRVSGLLEAAKSAGGDIIYGGEVDAEELYLAPTVIQDVPADATLLHDEIFGPVLPVVTYHTLNEAIAFINAREKPLSLYVFSRSNANVEAVLQRTSAGGTCVNETLLHYFNEYLPFGGAGNSGIGRGHGHAGFLSFSNQRAVLHRAFHNPLIRLLYPPFGRGAHWLLNVLAKYL